MRTYEVTIRAVIVKTVTVEAENEKLAVERAHDGFDCTDPDSHYDEETQSVTEVQ